MGLCTDTNRRGGSTNHNVSSSWMNKKDNTIPVHQLAIGFGSNYYWALDSSQSVRALTEAEEEEEEQDRMKGKQTERRVCYEWSSVNTPPWKEKVNIMQQPFKAREVDNTLGITDSNNTDVANDYIIEQIACSSQATIFLTKAGKIYQQGTMHGHVFRQSTLLSLPPTVPATTKIKQIVAGRHFALALAESGSGVFCWGAGHFGQFGTCTLPEGENNYDCQQEAIRNGEIVERCSQLVFSHKPVLIDSLLPQNNVERSPIVSIAAGDWHALALTASGKVWAWGCNRNYQCGQDPNTTCSRSGTSSSSNNNPSLAITLASTYGDVNEAKLATVIVKPLIVPLPVRVTQIAAGGSHSIAVASETQKVYCWGNNRYGQCGSSEFGSSAGIKPNAVKALNGIDIAQIAAGGNHTVALTKTGQVLSWGDHTQGQLGIMNGSTLGCITQFKPRRVQELDSTDLRKGKTSLTELYLSSSDMSDSSPPPSPRSIDNDTIYSNQTTEELVHPLSKIASVYAGTNYSAAICESGHVYVWGSNDCGQLGIPSPVNDEDIPMIRDGSRLPCIKGSISSSRRSSRLGQPMLAPRRRTVTTKRQIIRNVKTFDSDHNILLPMHLDSASHVHARSVACGPNHMWVLGEARLMLDNHSESDSAMVEEKLSKQFFDQRNCFPSNENLQIKMKV